MSMLSAQCDELREMADQLQEHGTFAGFGGTTNTDPLMLGAAIVMREAADTIWDLRDMVHKERAEADRLREERDMYRDLVDHMVHPDIPDQLAAENAKLRELCATVIDDWMSKVCPSFPFCECGGEYQDCTDETCGNQIYRQMARDLGVDDV